MTLDRIDFFVIGGYFLFIILLGSFYGRKEKNLTDYFLGGRNIKWFFILFSIVATEASALTFVGAPAFAYTNNWTYIQLVIGTILARFILAGVFIKAFYHNRVYTVYQYLGIRFGGGSKNISSILFLMTRCLASGVRLFGASILVSVATGLNPLSSIIIIASIATIYTIIGGIKAVIFTDACQAIIMFGGASLALYFIYSEIPQGWQGVMSATTGLSKFKTFDFSFSYKDAYTIWAGIVGSTFFTLATHGTDQDLVQRMLTAKDAWQSKKALILSGFIDIPIVVLFLSIGSLLFALYQIVPTPDLPAKADNIFPYYIVHGLPPGITGLLIAGVLAAAMSSIDSALNALSTTWVNDFYRPYFKKDASQRHYLTMAKVFTALFAVFLIAIAYLCKDTKQVLILGFVIGSFTYGALLGVFLLGLLTKRGNNVGNMMGMTASIIALLLIKFYTEIAWVWYVMIGTLITFGIGYLFPSKKKM
ncbi:MAG: sodium:solute symporter [Thermodesulfobacteriota bacterium]|nr:sodium:solute symporter [Thermodesulfobacteriota bacterium]